MDSNSILPSPTQSNHIKIDTTTTQEHIPPIPIHSGPPSIGAISTPAQQPTRASLTSDILNMELRLSTHDSIRRNKFKKRTSYVSSVNSGTELDVLDDLLIRATTDLVVREKMSVAALCRFVRGQTTEDNRPNKALDIINLETDLQGFPDKDILLDIARNGVKSHMKKTLAPQKTPPRNHPSVKANLMTVIKKLSAEQKKGRCVILKHSEVKDMWKDVVHLSPIGLVGKAGQPLSNDGRIIHDLSWPKKPNSNSVNARSCKESVPRPVYLHSSRVARRILDLKEKFPGVPVKIMAGDVSSAFRNVPIHEEHVKNFAFIIPELDILVLELYCTFGWTGSPGYYDVFTRAIKFVQGNMTDPEDRDNALGRLFLYAWVDDHIIVEPDIGNRVAFAEFALRSSITRVLGPRSKRSARRRP